METILQLQLNRVMFLDCQSKGYHEWEEGASEQSDWAKLISLYFLKAARCHLGISLCSHKAVQFSSVAQSFPTLCDPMDCSMPGLPVHHQLQEITQTHVHWVSDATQPSHPLPSPTPPSIFPKSSQISQFFTSGGQSTGVLASASVLPMNIQDWFI